MSDLTQLAEQTGIEARHILTAAQMVLADLEQMGATEELYGEDAGEVAAALLLKNKSRVEHMANVIHSNSEALDALCWQVYGLPKQ